MSDFDEWGSKNIYELSSVELVAFTKDLIAEVKRIWGVGVVVSKKEIITTLAENSKLNTSEISLGLLVATDWRSLKSVEINNGTAIEVPLE